MFLLRSQSGAGIILMTNATQRADSLPRDRPASNSPNNKDFERFLSVTEETLRSYFSVRERAGREGLLEWELNYITGRIALAFVTDRDEPVSGEGV
jgi:hypothetical protein